MSLCLLLAANKNCHRQNQNQEFREEFPWEYCGFSARYKVAVMPLGCKVKIEGVCGADVVQESLVECCRYW